MAKLAAGGGPALPEDLVFSEILTRLQAKPLLRCRAVSRSWRRRLTTDAEFLLAHHRRQPSLPLLTTWDSDILDRRIDVLDHRAAERRPVAQITVGNAGADFEFDVLASCDGLIIHNAYERLEICNPATRQRATLALLDGADACVSALYRHGPSGSYRVLCFKRTGDGHAVFHVHTVGSGELRCVGEPPVPWASRGIAVAMQMLHWFYPVLADGKIYWPPQRLSGCNSNGKTSNMLVFDTVAESFQHLLSPVEGAVVGDPCLELFETSNGALGLYDTRGNTADLWVLQDHKSWTWSLNNRIKLPSDVVSVMPVLEDPEGDVLVLSDRKGLSFEAQHLHHISGANGSSLARYEWNDSMAYCRHWFRESLVRHDFFSMEGNAGGVGEKPLFDDLSTVELVRDDNPIGTDKKKGLQKKVRKFSGGWLPTSDPRGSTGETT